MDGTHTGTGGGSHLTLGGPTPADSPLLRRPDLLVSMLTFWQHHPSLSYLFSGRFIGPTSQAPRVDEGRHETLYELEIAFAELAELPIPRPWQADRALRHLLTDITGNTHRSEFCIDKMYSPDSERGRLGLLELRGFEMAPHPSMALVQALLVRCPRRAVLVGAVRRSAGPLGHPAARRVPAAVVRPAGHGRRRGRPATHGLDFDPAWLEPFFEFRFPAVGLVDVEGVRLELRQAIEPWHVLGEEVTGAGTARYVDSSVERLEVAVRGAVVRAPPADLQRRPGAAARRPARPAAGCGSAVPGLGAVLGAAPEIGVQAPLSSTSSTAGAAARSAAAPITSSTRAAWPSTTCRSTRPRPSRAAGRGSAPTATRRARSTSSCLPARHAPAPALVTRDQEYRGHARPAPGRAGDRSPDRSGPP